MLIHYFMGLFLHKQQSIVPKREFVVLLGGFMACSFQDRHYRPVDFELRHEALQLWVES